MGAWKKLDSHQVGYQMKGVIYFANGEMGTGDMSIGNCVDRNEVLFMFNGNCID